MLVLIIEQYRLSVKLYENVIKKKLKLYIYISIIKNNNKKK